MSKLRPPLRLSWSYPGAISVSVTSNGDHIVATLYPKDMVCLDLAGHLKWRVSGGFYDRLIVQGTEAFAKSENSLFRIDVKTGELRTLPFDEHALVWVSEDGATALSRIHKPDFAMEFERCSVQRIVLDRNVTELWKREDSGPMDCTNYFGYNIAVAGDRIFLPRSNAHLVCLELSSGETIWEADLNRTKEDPSVGVAADLRVSPVVFGNRVLAATPFGIAAFDADKGTLLWSNHVHAGPFAPYSDRLYIVTGLNYTGYRVVDLNSGSTLLEREVSDDIARAFGFEERVGLESSLAVTETHTFVGDNVGRLWALERDTGEPVWFDHPETATPYVAVRVPIISEGRLYINGFSMDPDRPQHLYCYEQA